MEYHESHITLSWIWFMLWSGLPCHATRNISIIWQFFYIISYGKIPMTHCGHIEVSISCYPSWSCPISLNGQSAFWKTSFCSCPVAPRDCENAGLRVACHNCFQCLILVCWNLKFGKAMCLLYLCLSPHPLFNIMLCHLVDLPCVHISYTSMICKLSLLF